MKRRSARVDTWSRGREKSTLISSIICDGLGETTNVKVDLEGVNELAEVWECLIARGEALGGPERIEWYLSWWRKVEARVAGELGKCHREKQAIKADVSSSTSREMDGASRDVMGGRS